ncbi:endochitinase [Diplonema papillatum]|nr:endochitinase [Diplonema papillatum]KAJ9468473.1 endochitinase [Diplonema papillatum]|eukprot:gene16716-25663_t
MGSWPVVVTALLLALACGEVQAETHQMVCVCRCCYLGDCKAIANATAPLDTCTLCTKKKCMQLIANSTDEAAGGCLQTANTFVKAECYNRNAFFPKLTCFVLIGLLTGLVVFGVAKDHIPALAAYSAKHFNY